MEKSERLVRQVRSGIESDSSRLLAFELRTAWPLLELMAVEIDARKKIMQGIENKNNNK